MDKKLTQERRTVQLPLKVYGSEPSPRIAGRMSSGCVAKVLTFWTGIYVIKGEILLYSANVSKTEEVGSSRQTLRERISNGRMSESNPRILQLLMKKYYFTTCC